MQGARAVQQSIIEDYPDADLSVSIVWINMLDADNKVTAKQAAGGMPADPRLCHFHDPEQRVGKVIAQGLGGEGDAVAWDIYLFYETGSEWLEAPPTPAAWMHQLQGSSWADLAHHRTGENLVAELHETVKRLSDF